MARCDAVSQPSKPGVVGPSPTGHIGFPSEAEAAEGRNRSLQTGFGPHTVPENGTSEQLRGRAALNGRLVLVGLVRAWVARFRAMVRVDESGCHLWTGTVQTRGYGSFCKGGAGRNMLAHRFAWELERGPIPDGLTVDHTCFNKRCQNVAHMELVTREENSRRARARQYGTATARAA